MTAGGELPEGVHVTPFYCPYCGESDIRPAEEARVYDCASCARAWTLTYRGLAGARAPASAP